jgi:hypothetical protein
LAIDLLRRRHDTSESRIVTSFLLTASAGTVAARSAPVNARREPIHREIQRSFFIAISVDYTPIEASGPGRRPIGRAVPSRNVRLGDTVFGAIEW